MADSGVDNNPTIFDYLNDDCWRAVLNYVPVKDIMRSERVSRQWQRVLFIYFNGSRVGIGLPWLAAGEIVRSIRWLKRRVTNYSSFERWTQKLGSSVVSSLCDEEEIFRIITEHCPYLETVKFLRLKKLSLSNYKLEVLKRLRQVFISDCDFSDSCINQLAISSELRYLEVWHNTFLTGECFKNIESTNLRSLVLTRCDALEPNYFLEVGRFTGLTNLQLIDLPKEIYKNVYLVLENMPKLEHLRLDHYKRIDCNNLPEYICRLSRLKHLGGNGVASDKGLDAVTRCCKELQYLHLNNCPDVTGRGVAAVCRNAGSRLIKFVNVHSQHLTDEDVLNCIRSCPKLMDLDVRWSKRLSAEMELLPRIAEERRRLDPKTPALRYRIDSRTQNLLIRDGNLNMYKELILS